MTCTVSLFAAAADAIGQTELTVDCPDGSTCEAILSLLREQHAALRDIPLRVAVNLEFADADQIVHAGDTVALIPPVAGG